MDASSDVRVRRLLSSRLPPCLAVTFLLIVIFEVCPSRLPVVQRSSGGSVHGGYGFLGHWRTCGDNRIDDSSTLHLGHRGRNLRYRGGVGHTASGFFQVDGQPHLSNGSHSPPFRAERLEGNEGGNPFLDSFTTLRHRGFGHAETTLG